MARVSWKNPVTGSWNSGSKWSTGTVPTAADDVTIAAAGTYTVMVLASDHAHSVTIDDAGATLQVGDTLTVGTTLALDAGTLVLERNATIAGGTIIANGGDFKATLHGTLDGVTWQGPLVLDAGKPNQPGLADIVYVENGFRVTGGR